MDKKTIKDAIDRSREYNEVVRCEATSEHLDSFLEHFTSDYDITQQNRDDQGREVLDMYGTDWRIQITVNK
jgi:hypothetical protein